MLQALGAAFAAGMIAIAVTWSIERWGGRVGGLLGTLPSTIIPASCGIYAGGDLLVFQRAMDAASAGMLVNAIFLWSWRVLPPKLPAWSLPIRLGVMAVASLGIWLVLAVGVVRLGNWQMGTLDTAWLGWSGLALLVVFGLLGSWRGVPAPRGARSVSRWMLLCRGAFTAIAIGVAIGIAQWAGGLAAGVASIFPAMFLTAMLALWLSQGRAVPAGAVGPMMLGSSSVAVYAMVARGAMPAWGMLEGALAAWVVAVLVATMPAWFWLGWRRGVTNAS